MSAIDQALVDLIADHQQVVTLDDRRDSLQVLAVEDRSGRVVRVAEEERLRPRGDGCLDHLGGDLEVGLVARGDRHRDATRQRDAGRIGHEARLVVDDLVARVADRPQAGVDRLGCADGDDQLPARLVADAVPAL